MGYPKKMSHNKRFEFIKFKYGLCSFVLYDNME